MHCAVGSRYLYLQGRPDGGPRGGGFGECPPNIGKQSAKRSLSTYLYIEVLLQKGGHLTIGIVKQVKLIGHRTSHQFLSDFTYIGNFK